MDNSPRISVLLPVHNAERYVATAIESIIGQSFRDWELIIIDDGSTDRSLDVLQRFASADQRIQIISRANTGYVVALNEGLGHARGEFIARMDADDISLSDRFRAQVAYLDSHPEYVAVGTAFRYIDQHGTSIGVSLPETDPTKLQHLLLTHKGLVIAHPTAMIRRDALEQIGGYRPEMIPAEDWDLWLRLDEIGELSNVPDVLFEYRVHLSSITNTHRSIQLKQAYRAIGEAYGRRGLDSPPIAPSISATREQTLRQWYNMAREHGANGAARRFACQLIKSAPLTRSHWSMLMDVSLDQTSVRAVRGVYRGVRRPFGTRRARTAWTVPRSNNDRPRVAFVSSSDGYGGDVRYWLGLIQDPIFRDSIDCHVILWGSLEHEEVKRELDHVSVPTYTLNRIGIPATGISQRVVTKARRALGNPQPDHLFAQIKDINPDLVWFNFGGVEFPALQPTIEKCRAVNIPYWYVSHNVPNSYLFANARHTAQVAPLIKGAATFASNSQTGMRDVERALATQLLNQLIFHVSKPRAFIESAHRVSLEHPILTDGVARFVHIGSLTPRYKGQHVLFEALASPIWKTRNWRLTCYGSGPELEYLTRLISYFGLERQIVLAGETKSVLDALASSDLFVFPSLSEGKGFALVEAMACGRPAVGTAIGGIPELVLDGVTGWLARAATVEEIASTMDRAWRDRSHWPEFGQRARNHVSHEFSHDATIPLLLKKLYQDLGVEWRSPRE